MEVCACVCDSGEIGGMGSKAVIGCALKVSITGVALPNHGLCTLFTPHTTKIDYCKPW